MSILGLRGPGGDLLRIVAIGSCVLPGCSLIVGGDDDPPDPNPVFAGCFAGPDSQGHNTQLVLEIEGSAVTGCLFLNQGRPAPERRLFTLAGGTEDSADELLLTLTDSAAMEEVRATLKENSVGEADDEVSLAGVDADIEGGTIEGMTRDCPLVRDECDEFMGGFG